MATISLSSKVVLEVARGRLIAGESFFIPSDVGSSIRSLALSFSSFSFPFSAAEEYWPVP